MHCVVHTGLLASVKKQYSSPAWQIFKGCFHSILWTLRGKFHPQNESLKGGLEVLVREYTQNGDFQKPWSSQQNWYENVKLNMLIIIPSLKDLASTISKKEPMLKVFSNPKFRCMNYTHYLQNMSNSQKALCSDLVYAFNNHTKFQLNRIWT